MRTSKAMDLRHLPSKTWTLNLGWVLAANLPADLDAWTRPLGLHDDPELTHAEPATLRYCLWHLPARLVSHASFRTRQRSGYFVSEIASRRIADDSLRDGDSPINDQIRMEFYDTCRLQLTCSLNWRIRDTCHVARASAKSSPVNERRTQFSTRVALVGGIGIALAAQRSGVLMRLVPQLAHAIAKRSMVALSGADE